MVGSSEGRLRKTIFIISFILNILLTLFLFWSMNVRMSRYDDILNEITTKYGAQNSTCTQVPGQPGKQGPMGLQGPPGPIGPKGDPSNDKVPLVSINGTNMHTFGESAVHLTGKHISHYLWHDFAKNWVPLGIWTSNLLGHSTPGMFSKNAPTYIHILETGKYFIYAQIYFQLPSDPPDNFQTYLMFLVVRESRERKIIIMRAIQTNGVAGKKSGYFTLYTSGLHVLTEGDVVYVAVLKEQFGYVNSADTTSYFGALKI